MALEGQRDGRGWRWMAVGGGGLVGFDGGCLLAGIISLVSRAAI
ncbi:hypothetical protein AB0I10_03115 [Streptomyces sp. NPDC050636]